MAETTKIALIQMRCGPEPEKNFAHAIEFIREAAGKGAQMVCLPELFRSQYFCQTEDHKNFDLAEEVPGTSTAALAELARETGTVIIASLFERRSAGVYHTPPQSSTRTASTARCTFRTIRYITRNFISPPGTLGSDRGTPSTAKSGSAFAGTNGIPK